MTTWSFDVLRQSSIDLWLVVCAVASVVVLAHALFGRLWSLPGGWWFVGISPIPALGTAAILVIPGLQSAAVGLVWTLVVLASLSASFYFRLLPQLGPKRAGILLSVRMLVLLLLVPMLFEPVVRFISRPRPQKPLIFLVDASGSMSFPDVPNGPTRIQSVWQALRSQVQKVNQHFVGRYFAFSTSAVQLKDAEELARQPADGKATDLAGSVQQVLSRSPPDSTLIVISDGIDNVSANVVDALRSSPRPIHTVRVGSEQAEPASLPNVAVENIEASDDFVVHHESKLRATIKSTALPNRVVEVKLAELDASGKATSAVTTKTLLLQPLPQGQAIELPFTPKTVGIQRLAIWIDPIAGERSTVDNRQEFQGLALDPRIKVLYVEGRVRPEYTQLNRALSRDPNIELATLLRITQDRFAASGTVDGEPISRLPTAGDEWKKFDVILLGDIDSSFLTKLQQTAIEQFALKGGGLLMIGGQNNFGPGGYKDSPIEKALPVFVGDQTSPQERTPFVPRLTPDGQVHPAMEGLSAWFSGTSSAASTMPGALRALPPLRGNVVVPRPKTGAQVLLVHPDRPGPDGQPQIVLAVQRYGEGRAAAFTADTTFLWYLPLRGMGQDSPYNRFWGQLIRWLANADTRNRSRGPGIDGLLSKSLFQLGEGVRVRAMVRDERGDATRYAQVNLTLRRAGSAGSSASTQPAQFPLSPVETRTGLYDLTISNPDKGDWIAELTASKDGKLLGKQELRFTVIPPAEEMLKLAANPTLLRAVAEQTRGFYFELAQLPTLLDELIRSDKSASSPRQYTVPLASLPRVLLAIIGRFPDWPARYDLPMQGFLVILVLAGEWFLRRHWQLP